MLDLCLEVPYLYNVIINQSNKTIKIMRTSNQDLFNTNENQALVYNENLEVLETLTALIPEVQYEIRRTYSDNTALVCFEKSEAYTKFRKTYEEMLYAGKFEHIYG